MITPETELEKQILADPELQKGLAWGKPRPGHPEGSVQLHVEEVLKNFDEAPKVNREPLRLIALIHDSFKYKVDRTKPRSGENHHGMIARRFAEKYITDKRTLDIIELHDEAYNAWSKGNRDGDWNKAERRAQKLIQRLDMSIYLYIAFYKADNETGDKQGENFSWFLDQMEEAGF